MGAVGSFNSEIKDIANAPAHATLAYENGNVEIIQWHTKDTWSSTTFLAVDLYSPYAGPISYGKNPAVMNEEYAAVAFTTADDKKLVNVFRKDGSGAYQHLARRVIFPDMPGSYITGVAITQKRTDNTRFLFVSWRHEGNTVSGMNVFKLDGNTFGDSAVIPWADSFWNCKEVYAIEALQGVTDKDDALVVVAQTDYKQASWPYNGCDFSKMSSSITLYGLDNNDGQFKTRTTVGVPGLIIYDISSSGDRIIAHQFNDINSVLKVNHNGVAYSLQSVYDYDPFIFYCTANDPAIDGAPVYIKPQMLGFGGEAVAEIFSGEDRILIGWRSSENSDVFSLHGTAIPISSSIVSSYNGYLAFAHPVIQQVFITLPFNYENQGGSRIKTEEEISAKSEILFEGMEFEIFPNPTTNMISMQWQENFTDVVVEIVNSIGKTVGKKQLTTSNNQIDLSELNADLYMLKISLTDGGGKRKSLTRPVIKR
ncbi:hypothetical protein SanaruYs_25200 [Chryseotalea sanaruensis]|uniref:Secretion system C-terminal sorting domain-containing protein n=2 Tax=Chryseotalea sanaruensis TaxID=2482724 RepID=A0A401UBQ2_9BACT|nr:hypothetical protein SanaruYs_25200 [Chryseotalea sanaruensis]